MAGPFPRSIHTTPIEMHGALMQGRSAIWPPLKGKIYVCFWMLSAPGSQPVQYKRHHSWSVKIIPCLLWIPDFWKGQNSVWKEESHYTYEGPEHKKSIIQCITILTNDQKHSAVDDMKVYSTITAIWSVYYVLSTKLSALHISSHFILTKVMWVDIIHIL